MTTAPNQQRRTISRRARQGVTAIESMIVLVVVLFIIFGGLDLGLAVTQYNSLCEAARRGARSTTEHGDMATSLGSMGPTTMNFTADQSNSITDGFRFLLTAMNPSDVKGEVDWLDGDNDVDDRVQVTLQYKHRCLLPTFLGFGDCNFRAVSIMPISH